MNRPIAFFDFDGTLTRGDSLIPFLRMVRGTPRFALDLLGASPWVGAYVMHLMRNDRAKEALLMQSLAGISMNELRVHGRRFAERHISSILRADMLERLRGHQEQGHACVLVSASLDLYLEPWAQANGFEFCLASSLAIDESNKATGKLRGTNCFGEEKVRRIQALLADIGRSPRTYAYGDSLGDIPMLDLVDEGYLVKKTIQPFATQLTIRK